jgi:hypothetical protein
VRVKDREQNLPLLATHRANVVVLAGASERTQHTGARGRWVAECVHQLAFANGTSFNSSWWPLVSRSSP